MVRDEDFLELSVKADPEVADANLRLEELLADRRITVDTSAENKTRTCRFVAARRRFLAQFTTTCSRGNTGSWR
jgi:hypothetical protein